MGKVKYLMSHDDAMMRYTYGDEGFGFTWNLLSEVGSSYQPWFFGEIVKRGWIVERGVVIERAPWCIDILLRKVEKGHGYVDTSY